MGCADAQVFSLAPRVPAPAAPPAVLGVPTPTPHRQTSGALERTSFFFRFSFGLHPPEESAFVCPSDRQSSGQTSGRTKGLSSGQTLGPEVQLGTILTVLFSVATIYLILMMS